MSSGFTRFMASLKYCHQVINHNDIHLTSNDEADEDNEVNGRLDVE